MSKFITVVNYSKISEFITTLEKDKEIYLNLNGVFFYSEGVRYLSHESTYKYFLYMCEENNVPIYVCINSIRKRKIQNLNPYIKITGLAILMEGVISSDQNIVF